MERTKDIYQIKEKRVRLERKGRQKKNQKNGEIRAEQNKTDWSKSTGTRTLIPQKFLITCGGLPSGDWRWEGLRLLGGLGERDQSAVV